jgi:anti-sigma regulatory factor (Ser/Thr protein kinase)
MFLYLVYECECDDECEYDDRGNFKLHLQGIYESLDNAIEHYEATDESGEIVTLSISCSSEEVEKQVADKVFDYLVEVMKKEEEKSAKSRKREKKNRK